MHRRTIVLALLFQSSTFFASGLLAAVPTPESDIGTARNLFSSTVQAKKPVSAWIAALHSKFGDGTSKVLHDILRSESSSDSMRWASLIGVARLQGKKSLETLRTYMSHSSWLLRDAAIKSAVALKARELAPEIESRLKDDALVIRTSAVDAIGQLKLTESSKKLVDALFDPSNIHGGKALWIHAHILKVIRDFRYEAAIPKLKELTHKLPKDRKGIAELKKTIQALKTEAKRLPQERL